MAFIQVANIANQYSENSGWFLKFYLPSTTTPFAMATDESGGTTLDKAELDIDGFITTDGSAKFIPFVERSYDAYLFPTAAEADANNTSNAVRIAENINPFESSLTTDITKLSITPVASQTVITIAARPEAVQVIKNNEVLEESNGDYTYSEITGDITLTVALLVSDSVEVQYGLIVPKVAPVSTTVKQYTNVASMVADTGLQVGEQAQTSFYYSVSDFGGALYRITNTAEIPLPNGWSQITLANGLVASLIVGDMLNVDQFGAASNVDSRAPIQAAIDYAQTLKGQTVPGKKTITSSGDSYPIRSIYPDTLPTHVTGNVGLWIEDSEFCQIEFNKGRVYVDTAFPAVANLEAVIAVVQETGDQAHGLISNIFIDGGNWATATDRPDYNLAMHYNVTKYFTLNIIRARYAAESNLKISGFAIEINKCDFRNAEARANYEMVVTSVDGDGATRTSYSLINCTADQAGLHGYQMTGGNGHTYCSFITCTADNIGRDVGGSTIVANNDTAAAYRLTGVFGVTMLNCGAERSTRYARVNNGVNFSIKDGYGVNIGSTDAGNPVDAHIQFDGVRNDTRIFYEPSTSLNITDDNILHLIQPGAVFNTNTHEIGYSIPDDDILITDNDIDSSARSLVTRPGGNFTRGANNPGLDGLVVGDPRLGRDSSDWFDQNTLGARKHFKFETSDVIDINETLLTMTNPANTGYLAVEVEVVVGRSAGSVPFNPTRYIATAGWDTSNNTVTIFDKVNTSGEDITLGLSWSTNDLVLNCTTNFVTMLVTVTCVGRISGNTQTFNWGPTSN